MTSISEWYQNQYKKKINKIESKNEIKKNQQIESKNNFTIDSFEYKQTIGLILQSLMVIIQKKGFNLEQYLSPNCFHAQCRCDGCEYWNHQEEFIKLLFPTNAETVLLNDIKKIKVYCLSSPWQKCSREQEGYRDCRPKDWKEIEFSYFTDGNFKMKHLAGIVKKLRSQGNGYDFIFGGGNSFDTIAKINSKTALHFEILTTTKGGHSPCPKCGDIYNSGLFVVNPKKRDYKAEFLSRYEMRSCPLHKDKFIWDATKGTFLLCEKSCGTKEYLQSLLKTMESWSILQ